MDTEARLKKIKSLANETIHEVDLLLQGEQPKDPVKDIKAEWVDRKLIKVSWISQNPLVNLDIQFYDVKEEREWQHSVLKYNPKTLISAAKLEHFIRLGENDTDRHPYKIRIVSVDGEFTSEPIPLAANTADEEGEDKPGSETELKHMIWGWWDPLQTGESIDAFPFSNTIKTFSDNVDHALRSDAKYVIPYVGMPDGLSDSKIKQRLEHQCRHFIHETTDRIPFWIVQDEPKFGVDYQERLIAICKEVVPAIPATFSFSGTHMWAGRGIAQNIEHVHWNDYPFRGNGYPSSWGDVVTKEDFMRKHDELMKIIKSNTPEGVTLSITTQTFAGKWDKDDRWKWKFRQPPAWAPLLFAEFISKYNLTGGLHYLLRDRKEEIVASDDVEEMKQLQKNIEAVYSLIPEKHN